MNIVQKHLLGTPYELFVPTSDTHAMIMTDHVADDGLWDLFLHDVAPGDVVLDVGAHVGLFAFWACAKGARVFAFEPAPENLLCLSRSKDANTEADLTIVPKAVSDRNGRTEFTPDGPYGHIVNADRIDMPRVVVETARLDTVLAELNVGTIKYAKIDVEGHELEVLRGMPELLSSPQAPTLLCESNGYTLHVAGCTPSDLRRELESFGYENFRLHKDKIVPAPVDEIQPGNVTDILAVPRARAAGFCNNPRLTETELLVWIAETLEIATWPNLNPQERANWTEHLERELARFGR